MMERVRLMMLRQRKHGTVIGEAGVNQRQFWQIDK